MLNHFFRLFIRTLKTKKLYSAVNLFSLSLSICVAVLLYSFIKYEMSFDGFHQSARQIYRVDTNILIPAVSEEVWRMPALSDPMVERIRAEVPGIDKSTRFFQGMRKNIVHISNKSIAEKLTYVDNDFFSLFSFELVKGNTQNVFDDKSGIVITQEIADRYFGDADPINQIVTVDGAEETTIYTIKGVIKTPPSNSSITFDLLAPMESYPYYEEYRTSWNEHNYSFFVKLKDDFTTNNLINSLDKIAKVSTALVVSDSQDIFKLSVTPLTDIHWNTEIPWEKTSNFQNVKVLSGIVLIVIIMACSNFISLALVNSSKRRIEVGIKRLLGSQKRALALQFISESIIFTIVSALLGLIVVRFLLPFFNSIIGIEQTIHFDGWDTFLFIALIFFIGFLAGSYPAAILSSFRPAEILKSHSVFKVKHSMVSVLVFFQAMLSLFLGSSALIMSRQMHQINSKDLGFNHEQLIVLPTFTSGDEALRIIKNFKNAAAYEPGIQRVTSTSNSFFEGLSSMGYTGKDGERKSAKAYSVDTDFMQTLGLKITAGRDFDPKNLADSNSVIINKKLADEISNSPLGNTFTWGKEQSSEIIGIVKDFNFRSLEFPIDPLFITINKDIIRPSVLLVKLDSKNVSNTLSRIEEIYNKVNPNKPFEFRFLSDTVQSQYKSYKMWTTIIQFANLFALFIACIGLFGLAGVEAMNKYKEIGIRKVFGASTKQILLRISRRYVALVLSASLIASALSHIVMSNWLSNFAFKINIDWQIYIIGILAALGILAVSIGYHTISAARSNPSQTLKHEG